MFDSQRKTENLCNGIVVQGAVSDLGTFQESNIRVRVEYQPVEPETEYTLSCNLAIRTIYAYYNQDKVDIIWSKTQQNYTVTFTTPANCNQISFAFMGNPNTENITPSDIEFVMLNLGSTPLPYEPYWQHSLRKLGTSTDTITTLPADVYADGNNATVGLVGNMEQTGTPSPSSIIIPQECGERTGNLFEAFISGNAINENGVIVASTNYNMYIAKIEQGKTYTIAETANCGFFNTMPARGSESYDHARYSINNFTAPIDGYVAVRVSISNTTPMINEGSTPLPYEPYGYKIPILCGGTTTPVYLGEVQTTRKIKKLVLTGNETITLNGKYDIREVLQAYYTLPSIGTTTATNIICSHLRTFSSAASTSSSEGIAMRANGTDMIFGVSFATINVSVSDSQAVALTKLMAYLSEQYANGTPVTVWYVLATPTTGIVNEPIRKIGDYADTVSGITIPTIAGADSFDVLTTLKPSKVTANYHGWHTGAVHERESGAWTE